MPLREDFLDGSTSVHDFDLNATNAAVNALTAALPVVDTYANIKALTPGKTGRMGYCTDCDAVLRDTGSVWQRVRFGEQGGTTQAEVPTTGWTVFGTGGTVTIGADRDGRRIQVAAEGGINLHGEYRALPSPSNYTVTMYAESRLTMGNEVVSGFFLRDSVSGRVITFGHGWHSTDENGKGLQLKKYNSLTSFNSNYGFLRVWDMGGTPNWLRIIDDGTNRLYQWSFNGVDWMPWGNSSRTDWITPNQIGYMLFDSNIADGRTSSLRVRSWG